MTGVKRELPIHSAVASSDQRFLAFLVSKGADLHKLNARGNSFIHFEAGYSKRRAVKFALEHNMDITAGNKSIFFENVHISRPQTRDIQ